MLICLHIGAHETAGGYLQTRLMEERPKLAAAKVGLVAHGYFRRHVSDQLDDDGRHSGAKSGIQRSLASMTKFHAAQERMVMSDMNIAGLAPASAESAGLYPDIGARLSAVHAAMPRGHETEVFFCIRGYEAFFNSLYVFRTGAREPADMRRYRDLALKGARGWTEVVADIAAVAGADRTVIWTYEDFAAEPAIVSRALLGAAAPKAFLKADGALTPSLTRKGFAVHDRAAQVLSAAEHRNFARAVSRFAFDPPDQTFSLFNAAESDELGRRYRQDLADIAASGCRLIAREARPSPTSASAVLT